MALRYLNVLQRTSFCVFSYLCPNPDCLNLSDYNEVKITINYRYFVIILRFHVIFSTHPAMRLLICVRVLLLNLYNNIMLRDSVYCLDVQCYKHTILTLQLGFM